MPSGLRPLYPRERNPAPVVQEARWESGPVWTCTENYASTGFRSLNRPARSESLYRLRYTGLIYLWCRAELLDRLLQFWVDNILPDVISVRVILDLLMSAVSSVPGVSVMFTMLDSHSTRLFMQKL
jgi:hypothetical protein